LPYRLWARSSNSSLLGRERDEDRVIFFKEMLMKKIQDMTLEEIIDHLIEDRGLDPKVAKRLSDDPCFEGATWRPPGVERVVEDRESFFRAYADVQIAVVQGPV
jgi:hypothetical protein